MKIGSAVIFSFSFAVICILKSCAAKRHRDVYCGACLALLDEMMWEVNSVDPKKKIQIGSFRIDPKGNQDLQEIPLAKSTVHLTELLENICEQMSNYATSTSADGRRSFVRMSSRDGTSVSLSNIEITGEVHSQLKFACESLIEDHEEELILSIQAGVDNMREIICLELMNVCTKINITDFEAATKAVRTAPVGEAKNKEGDEENEAEEDALEPATEELDDETKEEL